MKTLFIQIILLIFSFSVYSQSIKIDGNYRLDGGNGELKIYLQNSKYYGKIIKNDKGENVKNGHILLNDFIYNSKKNIYTGTVNSPKGVTANGELEVIDNKTIKLTVQRFLTTKSFILEKI
ncbi:MAG: hypothetical protein JXR68_12730 [Bacteroidales bacterium]|nr:hypothetical protein [Bacteroidales bacterium]